MGAATCKRSTRLRGHSSAPNCIANSGLELSEARLPRIPYPSLKKTLRSCIHEINLNRVFNITPGTWAEEAMGYDGADHIWRKWIRKIALSGPALELTVSPITQTYGGGDRHGRSE
jgi:hypothetical protein